MLVYKVCPIGIMYYVERINNTHLILENLIIKVIYACNRSIEDPLFF